MKIIKKNSEEKLTHKISNLADQAEELRKQIHQLQMEKNALEKVNLLIKKGKGIDLQELSNSQKTILIDVLREQYCLTELLELFEISKSSYFYQHTLQNKPDKYEQLKEKITYIFTESGSTYGYRRVKAILSRDSMVVSEKVIRRIMKNERLIIKKIRMRKYNSYKGEVSTAVPNLIMRDFHATAPDKKWLTDITQFHIPAGKIYLSPIIDCFDGLPVSWTIGTSPNAELVNSMLDIAIRNLPNGSHPTIHSDRGCHYRWPGWIERMTSAKLTHSMSMKGCAPDNAACEAFWGRLKNEMFYCRTWYDTSLEEFAVILDNYIKWYSTKRIKISLGALSPLEYRLSLGLVP